LDIKKRVVGNLENTESVMNNTFFVGTFPGIDRPQIEHTLNVIEGFLSKRGR